MPWNATIRGIWTGQSELGVTFDNTPPPEPPPDNSRIVEGRSFLWTIHPKRRQQANIDTRRKRTPFRRLSLNTDFRAWRRIVRYTTKAIDWLCPDPEVFVAKTYGQWKETGATYGELKCTGLTYAELKGEMPT